MSAVDSLTEATKWADFLVTREVERTGLTRAEARPIVARKAGVPASKLYSLWRNRLKDTGSWKDRLKAAVIHELQSELQRLTHERDLLTATGAHPGSSAVASVLADIAAARTALGLPASPDRGGGNG